MHYYKRNIGDYHKKAGRLSMLQHGAYTLLMDSIYDREVFPTMEDAINWTWASSSNEIEAVEFVLKKFFTLVSDVYVQKRMAQEIQEYTGVCQTNAINGKKGGRPKGSKNKPKESEPVNKKTHSVNLKSELKRSESELKPNQEPLTTNQEPRTLKDIPPNRFDEFWDAFADKRGKTESLKAWKRLKLNDIADDVISGAKKYAVNRGYDRQYWKQAQGWLNGKRWHDDIPSTSEQAASKFDAIDYGDGIQDL